MALGADSSFSNEIMINRINSDLANGFGNLVSRTVAMVEKYFGGTLPTEREGGEFDDDLIATATALKSSVDDFIDKTQLNNALAEIFKVVSRANKYIDETAPWVIAKDETKKARLATVPVSYTHLRAHETGRNLVCRLLLEKKKKNRLLYTSPSPRDRQKTRMQPSA